MKKGHGCLWYIFIFPFVGPFYIAYYIIVYMFKGIFKLFSVIGTSSKKAVIEYNENMTGYQYEYLCANYLKSHGYRNVEVTKSSGDQGADIIAWKDGYKYAVQCKYYKSPVGNKAVQEAFSAKAYYGCNYAMVMTNNRFTQSAEELARSTNVILLPYIGPSVGAYNYIQNNNCTQPQEYVQKNNKQYKTSNFSYNASHIMSNNEIEQFAKECNAYVERMEKDND